MEHNDSEIRLAKPRDLKYFQNIHKLSIRLKPRHFSVGFVFIPGSQCSVQL